MAVLKAHTHYVNKSPKTNRYIDNIIPLVDREVSDRLFRCYEEKNAAEKPDGISEVQEAA